MKRALGEFTVRGIKTTIPFLINICKDRDFRKGNFDTSYLEKKMGELMPKDIEEPADIAAVIAAAIAARAGL
jgi:pyruvate carboxylase subunit A